MACTKTGLFLAAGYIYNTLSSNIHIQILHTDLYTFPQTIISWENLIKDQSIFSLVILLLILIT